MQPFARQPQKPTRSPWIVVFLCAAGFGIWFFDIVPKIRSVGTGTVAGLPGSADSPDSAFNADHSGWDEIVDSRRTQSDGSADTVDDALLSAINSVSEPLDFSAVDSANSDLYSRGSSSPSLSLGDSRIQTTAGERLSTGNEDRGAVQHATYDIPAQKPRAGRALTAIPADLAETLREVDLNYRNDRILDAHEALSRIYWSHPEYQVHIRSRLEHSASLIYTSPDLHINTPYLVQFGDTLNSIAKQHDVPWQYLAKLNRTSAEKLQAGSQLKVLTGPFSAVVDLQEFALTVHSHGWFVHRYAIGIGKDNRTPKGEYTIATKVENPRWYNPDGGEVDADDPANPLGEYWLGLGDHIGIHGTIDPDSIGKAASRGCIHLADADIEEVFHFLGIGSRILIRE